MKWLFQLKIDLKFIALRNGPLEFVQGKIKKKNFIHSNQHKKIPASPSIPTISYPPKNPVQPMEEKNHASLWNPDPPITFLMVRPLRNQPTSLLFPGRLPFFQGCSKKIIIIINKILHFVHCNKHLSSREWHLGCGNRW